MRRFCGSSGPHLFPRETAGELTRSTRRSNYSSSYGIWGIKNPWGNLVSYLEFQFQQYIASLAGLMKPSEKTLEMWVHVYVCYYLCLDHGCLMAGSVVLFRTIICINLWFFFTWKCFQKGAMIGYILFSFVQFHSPNAPFDLHTSHVHGSLVLSYAYRYTSTPLEDILILFECRFADTMILSTSK